MKRIYRSGSRWAFWRWAEAPLLYMKRLHLVHTPVGGVLLNFISKPDPWPDQHDHPVNFLSVILRGGYIEKRGAQTLHGYHSLYATQGQGRGLRRRLRMAVNRMPADRSVSHSIIWADPNTITLMLYGPRVRLWGYHTPTGWVAWRDYFPQSTEYSSAHEVKHD